VIRYIIRRLLQMVLTFFGTTLIVYALMFAAQTDPIQALVGERPVSQATRDYLTQRYHLDRHGVTGFFSRYWDYISHLLRGDLGQTLGGRSIGQILAQAWPYTLKLSAIAIVFVIVFGVTAGVVAGLRRGGLFDHATLALTLVVIGIPVFVLGFLGQYFLAVRWGIFPVNNQNTLYSLILPALVLSSLSLATALRLTSASISENLRADYVRTAKSKGLAPRRIVGVHVLRNSLIPIVTFIGVELGNLMAGAIVTERIFNIPGVGFNLYKAINTEDGPTVVAIVSVLVVIFLVVNLLVDLLYAVLDPRIRYE
jgi:peptide/nickel transport system permease protein/oligopeptide transport system permease protein